jgi:glycosyltransferase involved in cell wall biosynthesis
MIIYVPLEHIDKRYTTHLDRDITNYLNTNLIEYIKVEAPEINDELPKGMFLNAAGTIKTKAKQLEAIAELYKNNVINDDTTFFFSDIWFPGIESLAYLNYFYKVSPKITGIIHAGSFTDTDFVRDMERWAKNFEDIIFDIADEVFCASYFIKNDIIKKRIVDKNKLTITSLPLDSNLSTYKTAKPKEDIVVFNGRLCDEKQPHLFEELKKRFRGVTFVSTQEHDMSKDQYYKLLSKSKAVVSFALQENFGYGIAEAVYLGCVPVVPNRLVYPEMYDERYLYNTFEECCSLVADALNNEIQPPMLMLDKPFKTWFK